MRFQNKRLIYEIVRRGLIKVLSRRISTSDIIPPVTSMTENFDIQKEFYEKKINPSENQLMREFSSPSAETRNLSEHSKSFNYTDMQKSPLQTEIIVLKKNKLI